jgi:predicted O-methyltransferase YrrM/SAM-dependent methyltransferase
LNLLNRVPPDSVASAAAHRTLMMGALTRLMFHRGEAARTLSRVLRATALERAAPAERTWIDSIERRRRELTSGSAVRDHGLASIDGVERAPRAPRPDEIAAMAAVARWMSVPPLWGRFLFLLVRELQPHSCLELGMGFGISTAYQAAALELNGDGTLTTLDGAPDYAAFGQQGLSALRLDRRVGLQLGPIGDTLGDVLRRMDPVDFVLADADHTEQATLEHFRTMLGHLADGAVIVFDDINWTEGMKRAWRTIACHERVSLAVGMGRIGVAVISGTDVSGPRRIRPWALRKSAWLPLTSTFRALPVAVQRLAAELRVPPRGRVLDYGCGHAGYRRLFPDAEYVGADLPGNPHAAVELSEDGTVPAPDEGFDAVLSTQVLEHVPDPELYLSECFRLLRPGGRLLLSTHGIMAFHPSPEDYWRWTRPGLERVVQRAGFRLVHFEGVLGVASAGLMLVHIAVDPRLPRPLRLGFAICVQVLTAIVERIQSPERRNRDAMIFALVAEKPRPD